MVTLSEEKLLEIATLAQKSIETHDSRYEKKGVINVNDFWEQLTDESETPSLPEHKLEKVLSTLSQDELCQVKALMWLGRDSFLKGDIATNEEKYDALYQEAKRNSQDRYTVEYISAKFPVLAGYLKRGMIIMKVFEK